MTISRAEFRRLSTLLRQTDKALRKAQARQNVANAACHAASLQHGAAKEALRRYVEQHAGGRVWP